MTAVDVDALEAARAAATPGVWKLLGMTVHADQDGTSNADTAVLVAHTVYRDKHGKPRTWDADLICKMHAALPDLLAAVRERDALRADIEALAEELADRRYDGDDYLRGQSDAFQRASGLIRAALGAVDRECRGGSGGQCGARLPIRHATLICGRESGHDGDHRCTRADGTMTGWVDVPASVSS